MVAFPVALESHAILAECSNTGGKLPDARTLLRDLHDVAREGEKYHWLGREILGRRVRVKNDDAESVHLYQQRAAELDELF